jgi:hypothetical protein
MDVHLGSAVVAGLIGGLVMLAVQIGGSTVGRPFDVVAMWSRLLAVETRGAGLLMHLAVSAAIAVIYAIVFRIAGASEAGWAWGLTGGVIHWIVAGSFIGAMPGDDARGDGPGPFAMRLGSSAAFGFLVGHLAFGTIVGIAYFALHPEGGFLTAI